MKLRLIALTGAAYLLCYYLKVIWDKVRIVPKMESLLETDRNISRIFRKRRE